MLNSGIISGQEASVDNMAVELIWIGIGMGVVATALMDIYAMALRATAGIPAPNWAMVGRWVRQVSKGHVFHDDIAAVPEGTNEAALGWVFHYAVGIFYGVALAALMGHEWLAAPTLLPAWIFSILMLGFGWFLLQPGLGLGWAASKTPNPALVRVLGLAAHTVFGVGLWLGALVLA